MATPCDERLCSRVPQSSPPPFSATWSASLVYPTCVAPVGTALGLAAPRVGCWGASLAVGSAVLIILIMTMMGQSQSELCCGCYLQPCCCCCFFLFLFSLDSHPHLFLRSLLLQVTTSLRVHFTDEEAESQS